MMLFSCHTCDPVVRSIRTRSVKTEYHIKILGELLKLDRKYIHRLFRLHLVELGEKMSVTPLKLAIKYRHENRHL